MSEGLIVQDGPPREVYAAPRNEFVASFLGAANFLTGEVEQVKNGIGMIRLDSQAGMLELSLPNGIGLGDRAKIVIRPEDIDLHKDPPDKTANLVGGEMTRVVFEGAQSECFIKVHEHELRVRLHQADAPKVGEQVWLEINSERCVVYAR